MPRVKSASSNTPRYPVATGTPSGRVNCASVWTEEFHHCSQDETGPNLKARDPLAERVFTLRFSPFRRNCHIHPCGRYPVPCWESHVNQLAVRASWEAGSVPQWEKPPVQSQVIGTIGWVG